jgi:F-type H+/Na+-transporting ATPase subunit alpha
MLNLDQITQEILAQVNQVSDQPRFKSTGEILSVGDGVVTSDGLSQAQMGEIILMPGNLTGVVFNLKERQVDIVALGEISHLQPGDKVESSGQILSVNASQQLIGRVTNALLQPIDNGTALTADPEAKFMPVEKIAPGVIRRQDVRTPLQTGLKVIDALVPVGRGQRELIIGDRGTGKTALAVDAMIQQHTLNQRLQKGEKRVISIYVAVGQKQSKIAQVVGKLTETGAIGSAVVVAAAASETASLQYLAPFTGTALAEYFMDRGEDVLIIYDDLSKHAWAYRQLSLLLRRPSGREAYPGDVFYLHSRLLERAARMKDELGGGSITALPVIETQANDISAYIPTNVISITDGQIFLDPDLFNAGTRPAIAVGLSVSRVGGDAQTKAMKQVAGKLKLDLAQYRELAAFAQFGADSLDADTRKRLDRGRAMTELLKQPQYQPLLLEEMVAQIWLGQQGYLDAVPLEKVADYCDAFVNQLRGVKSAPLSAIREAKQISGDTEKVLASVAEEVKKLFS